MQQVAPQTAIPFWKIRHLKILKMFPPFNPGRPFYKELKHANYFIYRDVSTHCILQRSTGNNLARQQAGTS